MTNDRPDPIENAASNPDSEIRRTGGSGDDPHGGDDRAPVGRPDPDSISELATIDGDSQDNDPDRPQLADQPGPQPGFGPDELTPPKIEGNPELGIDPREILGHRP